MRAKDAHQERRQPAPGACRRGVLRAGRICVSTSRTFPGNTNDNAIIRTVKADLTGWNLHRLVWVAERGFASAANRAYLTVGGGHYIHAEKLRHTNSEAAARPGRYRTVAGNLRVTEVAVSPGAR